MKTLLLATVVVGATVMLGTVAWSAMSRFVEQPSYNILMSAGSLEIRQYPPLVVAEVRRPGGRYEAVRSGFGPLARYIFAKDRPGDKIAMTAPVTQSKTEEDSDWVVRFIMPSEYSINDLPPPGTKDIEIKRLDASRKAAIRFSGVATDYLIAESEMRLRKWMNDNGLEPEGPPIYAYYNDPLTPGFLRRNEVLFDIEVQEDARAVDAPD